METKQPPSVMQNPHIGEEGSLIVSLGSFTVTRYDVVGGSMSAAIDEEVRKRVATVVPAVVDAFFDVETVTKMVGEAVKRALAKEG